MAGVPRGSSGQPSQSCQGLGSQNDAPMVFKACTSESSVEYWECSLSSNAQCPRPQRLIPHRTTVAFEWQHYENTRSALFCVPKCEFLWGIVVVRSTCCVCICFAFLLHFCSMGKRRRAFWVPKEQQGTHSLNLLNVLLKSETAGMCGSRRFSPSFPLCTVQSASPVALAFVTLDVHF